MIKNLFVLLLCTTCMQMLAQAGTRPSLYDTAKRELILTATLDGIPDDTIISLMEGRGGEWDTTRIKNHHFEIKRPMLKGGSVWILQIGHVTDPNTFNRNHFKILYLDSGNINIVGHKDGFEAATYTGSYWVSDWQEILGLVDNTSGDGKILADAQKRYAEANEVGDEDVKDSAMAVGNEADARLKVKYRQWLSTHPNSGCAGYLITCYFDNNEKVMDSLYDQLGDRAKQSRIVMDWKYPGKIDPIALKFGFDSSNVAGIPGQPKIGSDAPVFVSQDTSGNKVSLADFKGKYVLVDFWASWCVPCREQLPVLKASYDKYKTNKNFAVIGVSLDSKREGWVKAINSEKLDWVNVSGLKGWGDPSSRMYGVSAIPFNVLIGPDGKIVARNLSGESLDKKLAEVLQ